jgi:hypothetical protein
MTTTNNELIGTGRVDHPPFGHRIKGGATIVEYTHKDGPGPGWRRNGIGVCYRGGAYEPWVVWSIIQDEDGVWFAEHGDYFSTLSEATEQYKRRGGQS